jgi:hypothetical protein
MNRFSLALFLGVLCLPSLAYCQAGPEPPETGHPPSFTGAVGTFRMKAEARPRKVRVENPLILTLIITGKGRVTKPPGRPRLRESPKLTADFQIDDLSSQDAQPDERTWTFSYRLRPRQLQATKIPRLPFTYWQPNTGFQTTYTAAISLTLQPREKATLLADQPQTPGEVEMTYPLITGDRVLKRQSPDELPALRTLVILFLCPPLVCLGWYGIWRRCYPDAVRLSQQRRSRAARQALKSLSAVEKHALAGEVGARVAAAVSGYLRQRLDLPATELTPFEVTASLRQAGVAGPLAEEVASLFHACDAVRFAPAGMSGRENLAGRAIPLIRALENEPCFRPTS